jgi:hypothetical protein
MTTMLTPILPENNPPKSLPRVDLLGNAVAGKQDTKEYLADMLKELSAIAAWADLTIAQKYIEAALHEVEAQEDRD